MSVERAGVRSHRLLLAIPELDRGGPDAVFHRLLRHLVEQDVEVHLAVTGRSGHYLSQVDPRVSVHHVGAESSRYPVLAFLRLVRAIRPTVVLATLRMALTAGAVAPLLPRATRLVLRPANNVSLSSADSATARSLKRRAIDVAYRRTLGSADLVLCQSRGIQDDLTGLGIPRQRMVRIGNPVDVAELDRLAAEPAVLAGSPRLLGVGRLASQKGFDLLLEAVPAVLRQHPAAHLTIVGDGPDRAALEAQALRLGIAGSVTFAGFHPNPYAFMAGADLVVSSSRYEGFANSTLEALALGTPVVGTDGPGANDEMVVPGLNGALVAPGDVPALAAAICATLGRDHDRAAIRDDLAARFGLEAIGQAYWRALVDEDE